MFYSATLSARVQRPAGVQRLGQALWMLVGERLGSPADLLWANSILGVGGDRLLWEALEQADCLDLGNRLLARPLAALLCALWEGKPEDDAVLLWTLPDGLVVPGIDPKGYARGVRALICGAKVRVTLLAPYLEAEGMGQLQEDLLTALARAVRVVLVAQDANAVGAWASDSLESLRREARGLPGLLQVYSAPVTAPVLLHSKLVVVDGARGAVGSANLTGNALLRNLETGVVVGQRQALEIERVVRAAVELGRVRFVFNNESACG